MARFTAADVKELREQTGAGMMTVKNALDQADGDREKAIEIIRLKGLKSLSKREDRKAGAGLVTGAVLEGGTRGVLLEVNSETDFVSKNQKFVDFAAQVLDAAVAAKALDAAQVLAAPAEGGTVQDLVNGVGALFREKIQVRRIAWVQGGHVELYLHRTNPDVPPQVGVLLATDAAGAGIAHDVAMHIAAFSPLYLDRASVPADVLAKERATLEKLTRAEGKPEKIIPKIVEGRLRSFYEDTVLLDQGFARDPSTSVGAVLKSHGASATQFVRYHVGS